VTTRRDVLKTAACAAGASCLPFSAADSLAAGTAGKKPPIRFIFMTKGNGLPPHVLVPETFSKEEKAAPGSATVTWRGAKDNPKKPFDEDLTKHQLPQWMSALEGHKKDMAIIQGLSAYLMASGHNGKQACLGMYKVGNDGVGTPLRDLLWATVDVELGRLYESPFEHIELQVVANNRGIVAGRAATGKMQRNFAYADPQTAYTELFKSAALTKQAQHAWEADGQVLKFLHEHAASKEAGLDDVELLKMTNYKETIERTRTRKRRLENMSEQIRKNLPKLDEGHLAADATTVTRHKAYVEILLSALKAGLTNSVLFSLDNLFTNYTGLPQLAEADVLGLHGSVGHAGGYQGHSASQLREYIRIHHMGLMHRIADDLKKTPEGDGTMFDNTVIMYQSENGETHHSDGHQQPIVVLAGKNTKMNFLGHYIRLPGYGKPGHKTLGNWYTTILNNHGNDIPHFGAEDMNLKPRGILDQKGPIKDFLV
jgi:hypothetical protein